MPDKNDYHAFTSTTGGGSNSSGGAGGYGCFTWVLVAIGILWIIGKLAN